MGISAFLWVRKCCINQICRFRLQKHWSIKITSSHPDKQRKKEKENKMLTKLEEKIEKKMKWLRGGREREIERERGGS